MHILVSCGTSGGTTLQQVETRVEDPIITDSTAMTRAEKRFSAQAFCVLVLTCRGKALQVVQQAPRGFGFEAMEAATQRVRATSSSKVP